VATPDFLREVEDGISLGRGGGKRGVWGVSILGGRAGNGRSSRRVAGW